MSLSNYSVQFAPRTQQRAKVQLFSDIRKENQRFSVRAAVLGVGLVSVLSRSSVGGESVKRVVCGGGIGDEWREGIAKKRERVLPF